MLCRVYRSPRKEQMYLYVDSAEDLSRVPEELLAHFGTPEPVMLLKLDSDRTLARADVGEVMEQVLERGYYLQMPPRPGELRRDRCD